MTPEHDNAMMQTRRQFLGRTSAGIGSVALASLLNPRLFAGLAGFPNFAPKAKRVIYLFQSGAPSQFELLDHKPALAKAHGQVLGSEFFGGQRLTGMTSGQKEKKVCKSIYNFSRHGQSGTELSELLPHLGQVADELCVVRSMQTQAINHDPAITFFQTGFQQAGRPSMGAWASYGLGSESADLPAYVVMISQGSAKRDSQALYARLWGSGFLPSEHQGVKFRSSGDPVLYLSNPDGITAKRRRRMLDLGQALNREHHERLGDPEILTRIQQAEMAYRMQTSVPELMDTSSEPEHIFDLYGEIARKPGTYAANCLLARRLAERGAGFITITTNFVWDMHADANNATMIEGMGYVGTPFDHAVSAFIEDVEARGLRDKILLVCCGEMGRTPKVNARGGREHWAGVAPLLLYGGGLKMGHVVGSTTRDGGEPASDRITIPNLYATIMDTVLDTGTLRTMAGIPPEVQRVIHGADPITQLL